MAVVMRTLGDNGCIVRRIWLKNVERKHTQRRKEEKGCVVFTKLPLL